MVPKVRCTIQGWSKSLQACCHCPAQRCDTLQSGGITEGTGHGGSSLTAPQRPPTLYIVAYMTSGMIHFIQIPMTALNTEGETGTGTLLRKLMFHVVSFAPTANVSVRTWAHLHSVDKLMPSRCVTNEQIRLRLRPAEQFQKPLTKVHQSIKNENIYRTTSCRIFSLSTSTASFSWGQTGKQHHKEKAHLDAGWHSVNPPQPSQASHEDLYHTS